MDSTFQRFLSSIIVCTEEGYRDEDLHRLARQEHRLDYADRYIDLLSEIIKELLREGKLQKLQTFGYSLEQGHGNQVRDHLMSGADKVPREHLSEQVKCNFINLNKQCLITRNWESVYKILGDALFKHLYKEYIIFLRTRDDSLVQVSGTNIFVYLNDKLGRLQQAFYDERRSKETKAAAEQAEGQDGALGFQATDAAG